MGSHHPSIIGNSSELVYDKGSIIGVPGPLLEKRGEGMRSIHPVVVYTDDAGEKLWGQYQPFQAKTEKDGKIGFVIPIVVPKEAIRVLSGNTVEVQLDT